MTIRSTKRRTRCKKKGGTPIEPTSRGDAADRRDAERRRRANETVLDAVVRYLHTDEGSLNGTLLLAVVVSLIISSYSYLTRGGSRRTRKSRSSTRHSPSSALLNLTVEQLLANVSGETKCRNHINDIENIINGDAKIGNMTVRAIIVKFDKKSTEKEKDELFDNLVDEYNKCAK